MNLNTEGLLSIGDAKGSQNFVDVSDSQNYDSERAGSHGNILAQYSEKQTIQLGRNYALKHGLDAELFGKAAALSRAPEDFNSMAFLSDEEKSALDLEARKKWHIPRKLLEVVLLGSMAATVQGMDEAVVNGANLFFPSVMGIPGMKNADLIEGLVNGAPYLCSSMVCWTSDYWNRRLGRKWCIFWSCVISALSCIWQGLVNLKWYHLFIARFFMGFGMGIMAATVPAYTAETSPAHIRGSLVMLWQLFTCLGVMLGYVSSLAFYYVGDHGISGGLNWRLTLGSASIPALFVLLQIPFVPESPRWLMGKLLHAEAFESLKKLRHTDIQAARDCFYQYVLLNEEGSYTGMLFRTRVYEMFTVRRNRNAALGAWIVMFMQQFCGINVISYYSSSIFIQSGLSEVKAMLASWGFGMIEVLFCIPTFYTIDSVGRRNLLLSTFPFMSLCLLMTGFGFWIPNDTAADRNGRLACVTTGIYLFACFYNLGEGPIPFTYSAEAFPLYIRDLGMGFATSTCWFFNFILAFTWPRLRNAFKPQGAFGFYAAWNIVGFFMVLWLLPETKGLTLEELDDVFDVSLRKHAHYRTKEILHNFRRYVLRQDVGGMPPLYFHQRMALTNVNWKEKAEAFHEEEPPLL